MDNKKIIGQRINTALAINGMKQKDLAVKLGVTDNTISYFCSGSRIPNIEQIIKMSDILHVSSDYLLGLSDVQSTDTNIKAMCDYTGLWEYNIEEFHKNYSSEDNAMLFLNLLFYFDEFWDLFDNIKSVYEASSKNIELEAKLLRDKGRILINLDDLVRLSTDHELTLARYTGTRNLEKLYDAILRYAEYAKQKSNKEGENNAEHNEKTE